MDKSFVMRIGEHHSDEQLITTILKMAKVFNLKTVAEGVQNEEQFQFLLKNSCDIYQGYYFSKPLTKEHFEIYAKRGAVGKHLDALAYEI